MKLYLKFLAIHTKSRMQYKVSFFTSMLGQFITSFTAFASLYFLMNRFNEVKGFTKNQVFLCFAVVTFSFAFAECFVRGFDSFSGTISNGEFDRILVRPRNEILLVLCSKVELSKIGRFMQSVVIMIYAIPSCGVSWTIDKILLLIIMIVTTVILFSALFIIYAALCFFTTEGLEFMNIFTDGGREFGAYPLSIYGKGVLKFFTFVVPLALVQYYPFLYLTDKSDSIINYLTPFISCLFIIPSLLLWRIGLKHYKSTGS